MEKSLRCHPKNGVKAVKKFWFVLIALTGLFALLTGCKRKSVDYIPYMVPTARGESGTAIVESNEPSASTEAPLQQPQLTMTLAPQADTPTPQPHKVLPTLRTYEQQYTIQAGDSLAGIALRNQVSVRQILEANDIENANLITPGQVINIPPASANELASPFLIIPDSEIIYGPATRDFDVASIINQFNGKLSWYSERQDDGTMLTGAQIVQLVADENSVNPRLLLALLEYQSGCLLSRNENCDLENYPMRLLNNYSLGLYNQLSWTANELLRGSDLWGKSLLAVWTLADGEVMRIDPAINAGTASVQYLFSMLKGKTDWKTAVSEAGFFQTYINLFGYPFAFAVDPLLPEDLTQPEMILPLAKGDVWLFTSGPHWAWGTGSPWAALDFAPPGGEDDYGCYESNAPVLAAASGLVVRSGGSAVVIDLDGDGFEQTGWTLNYFHIKESSAVPVGTKVATGDVIGIASCEGGVTTGTHFHFARRYNGVWIEAHGAIPFNLGGWIAESYGIVYDGCLTKEGMTVEAYNGRAEFNEISN